MRSRPFTRLVSPSAKRAGATGAVGWITVSTWVSQKSSTLALAALRNAALSASTRSRRPITAACRPPEKVVSDRNAVSIAGSRQPVSATAKKFISARLASCTTGGLSASHFVSATNCASRCVTSVLCGILTPRAAGRASTAAAKSARMRR
jgi:hypothetical protein